ncbi:MAG TPA: hypothetical protein VMF69_23025 [Gemmataceae bacterium]|nr:hypothetical protein [Gemmataceae bacterium]
MDTDSILHSPRSKDDGRIGFLGVFVTPTVESAFREQHFRDNLWLSVFLVSAGMLRVVLFLLFDYQQFGVGLAFWLLFASRILFLLVSAWVLVALRRAVSAAASERLFFAWGFLIVAVTVCALSARPPSNSGLLLMSFGMIVATYCITPLPLFHQAALMLAYSAAALYVSRRADGVTLSTVGATYALSHLFGAVTSWRLNHRRREMFLGALREAQLRASLEAAVAEVRTLRGLLCMCAWCKRIRDEAEAWKPVEEYVQCRTHASFSHGICPDCFQSQFGEIDLMPAHAE